MAAQNMNISYKMIRKSDALAIFFLAGLAVLPMIVACQKPGQATIPHSGGSLPPGGGREGGGVVDGRATTGSGSSPTGAQGTADVGGGSGANGQVLESYIQRYHELRGYNLVLGPMFQNFSTELNADSKDKTRTLSIFEIIPYFKTWYVAPVRLKPIKKEILGLSFSESNLQQLAIQTIDEIVIDEDLTRNTSNEKFSALAVHETVMSWYLVRHVDFIKLCQSWQAKSGLDSCKFDGLAKLVASIGGLKPEKARPLAEEDYRRIRRVTDWVIRHGPTAKIADLRAILSANGFDSRLFSDTQKEPQIDMKDVAGDGVLKLLLLANRLDQDPRECWHLGQVSEGQPARAYGPCNLQVKVLETRPSKKFFSDEPSRSDHHLQFSFQLHGKRIDVKGWLSEAPGIVRSMGVVAICLQTDVRGALEGEVLRQACIYLAPTARFSETRLPLESRFELVGVGLLASIVVRAQTEQHGILTISTPYASGNQVRCLDLIPSPKADAEASSFVALRDQRFLDGTISAQTVVQLFSTKSCSPMEEIPGFRTDAE